MDKLLRRLVFV